MKNPNHDKVTVQYAEELIVNDNSVLAKDIIETLLARNTTYGPAKKLLDRINLNEVGRVSS